ncbi:MAG: NADH-quinone oxidoreductase subunit NuoE [Gammaproteobacteria bacterium]|nr:NADH-quinone oxidoreductase subunit NuoE [Gammaproteobacteria bacterium]
MIPAVNDKVLENARAALPASVVEFIDKVNQGERPSSHLIAVLHKVQEELGFLPRESMDAVAQLMQVPTAKVTGVASFYHHFSFVPKGKYIISVCTGTACYVKGAEEVIDKFKEELGINLGETTADGLFTLEDTRCLGACALAPVVKVGDDIHASMTADKVPGIIERYMNLAD